MHAWLVDESRSERSVLVARLAELLPGTAFNAEGYGVFRRGGYSIAFSVVDDDPPHVEVDLDRADGLAAITRIVEKTGWRLIDVDGRTPIDLGASRTAGAFVPVSVLIERPRRKRGAAGWIAAGVAAAAIGGWFVWSRISDEARIVEDGFEWSASRLTARRALVKTLPPDLQDNSGLVRLIDIALAERDYQERSPRHLYATVLHLTNPAFWKSRYGAPAMLPPAYSADRGEGYRFAFHGTRCVGLRDNDRATDCDSFVVHAVPLGPRQLGGDRPPGFALYSYDMGIRYREHAELPEEGDDVIAAIAAPKATASSAFQWPAWLGGPNAARDNEAAALRDLRDVSRAETIWMQGMTSSKYLPPEQLADAGMFARARIPEPLLPSRFQQRERDGYAFEFIGEQLVTVSANSNVFHPVYERFVYVARARTPGARSLALYPNGSIFAAPGTGIPTPQDEIIQPPTR